ncbi:mitogen-activated protein kinase kinase kinase 4-like [Amphiura filiformis]|uniref:mitogen-activated protein kinase kinase kinase 4-like n=1 Tax=Amphiura filiformis TaxID=82378 RepID=UPI003B21D659
MAEDEEEMRSDVPLHSDLIGIMDGIDDVLSQSGTMSSVEESTIGSYGTQEPQRWSFDTEQLLASSEQPFNVFPFEDEKFDSLDSDVGFGDGLLGTTPPRNHREEKRQGRRHSQKPPKLTIPKTTASASGRPYRNTPFVVRMEGLDESSFYLQQQVDEAKQGYRKQSRQLDKERTRDREFKHSAISIDTTDTTTTERFHSLPTMYEPLPSPIPKVDSFTPFRSIKSQQKSPPNSPSMSTARVKRLSSTSTKLHCPSDRVEFHNIFSKLIRMGTKKDTQNAENTRYSVQRQDSTPQQDMFQTEWNSLVWLELQAWQNGLTMMEQDKQLLESRELIESILHAIMTFKFDNTSNKKSEPNRCTLKKIPPAALMGSSLDGDDENGEWLPGAAAAEVVQGRSRHRCDSCSVSNAPGPFSRKISTSSDAACIPLSKALTDYIHDSREAWKVITKLLEQLEEAERLYPTQKALQTDFPQYGTFEFNERVKTMCLWLNVTNDLSLTFELTELGLGVFDVKESVWWPCIGCHAGGRHTCLGDEEYDETAGGYYDDNGQMEMVRPAVLRLDGANNEAQSENSDYDTPEADYHTPPVSQQNISEPPMVKPTARRLDLGQSSPTQNKSNLAENVESPSTQNKSNLAENVESSPIQNKSNLAENNESSPSEHKEDDNNKTRSSTESRSDRPMLGKRQKSVTFDIGDEPPDDEMGDDDSFYDDDDSAALSSPGRTSTPNSRSPLSADSPRLGRIFSACHFSFDYDSATAMYRPFVDRSLKHLGLRKMTLQLYHLLGPTLDKTKASLSKPAIMMEDMQTKRHGHVQEALIGPSKKPNPFAVYRSKPPGEDQVRLSYHGAWSKEFLAMGLPSFIPAYLFLLRIPLDVMHECLRFRLEHKPAVDPSAHSIQQLLHECKEVIRSSVNMKQYYHSQANAIMLDDAKAKEHVENDIDEYETDLQEMLQVYFEYLHSWILMLQRLPQASVSLKNIMEEEWGFAKAVCPHVRGGEAQVGKRFCIMATKLLESTGDYLEREVDDMASSLQDSQSFGDSMRRFIMESCRRFKNLFHEVKERASKALGFAKMLRKDLEIAAEFQQNVSVQEMLKVLKESGHVNVVLDTHDPGHLMFVPHHLKNNTQGILQLLNDLCGGDDLQPSPFTDPSIILSADPEGYLLLVEPNGRGSSPEMEKDLNSSTPPDVVLSGALTKWDGDSIKVSPTVEMTIALSDIQVNNLLLVVNHSAQLYNQRKAFQKAVGTAVTLTSDQTSSHNTIAEALEELKMHALTFCNKVLYAINQVDENLNHEHTPDLEEMERVNIHSYYKETMHQCYYVGFDYHKEVGRLLSGDARLKLAESSLKLAKKWMTFVLEKCERGRGTRPRWAHHGLDFLMVACEPRNVAHLSDEDFQDLKGLMNKCIVHVIGTHDSKSCPSSPAFGFPAPDMNHKHSRVTRSKSNKSSGSDATPSPHIASPVSFSEELRRTNSCDRFLSLIPTNSPTEEQQEPSFPRRKISNPISSPPAGSSQVTSPQSGITSPLSPKLSALSTSLSARTFQTILTKDPESEKKDRMTKIREALEELEVQRNTMLMERQRIGCVSDKPSDNESININCKKVTFGWQRGFKIGEGVSATVYSCINMETGETLAMKEVRFQRNDHSVIRDIADEFRNFEGIRHPNLVRYYGVEIHREELLIFMEYCDEGTIAEVAKAGLPEDMIRRYTREITIAISVLHERGIVHRDIKGANIFLSSDGHVKLGDFGCAVRLQKHNTMPGEISAFMGTAAYMAPEVITQTGQDKAGYGRAADIWSLGCVVIEMASGKRPWHEFDHEFTIVYKVGDGAIPHVPESLSPEGKDFLSHCLQHQSSERWTASELLDHSFIKVAGVELEDGDEEI